MGIDSHEKVTTMDISLHDVRQRPDVVYIDVRSPGEFAEGHIPGAHNVPLLDNDERAQVGTVYKHQGATAAKRLGLTLVSPKLPQLVETIRNLASERTPVIYCWRGGLRSKFVSMMAQFMDIPALRLVGGYKAYRRHVLAFHEAPSWNGRFIVLHGNTGVGKTEILQRLAADGYPVLDLEACASHRGSVFGHIGLGSQPSQPLFEAYLFETLDHLGDKPFIFLEAESRRIGKLMTPKWIMERKETGIHVWLTAALETRMQRIVAEYAPLDPEMVRIQWREALVSIEKRLERTVRAAIHEALDRYDFATAARLLLEHWYDPRYRHARQRYVERFEATVDAENLDAAVDALKRLYDRLASVAPAAVGN